MKYIIYVAFCLSMVLIVIIIVAADQPQRSWGHSQKIESIRSIMLNNNVPTLYVDTLLEMPILIVPNWPLPWDTIKGNIFIKKGSRFLVISGDYYIALEMTATTDFMASKRDIYNMRYIGK